MLVAGTPEQQQAGSRAWQSLIKRMLPGSKKKTVQAAAMEPSSKQTPAGESAKRLMLSMLMIAGCKLLQTSLPCIAGVHHHVHAKDL